MSGLDDEPPVEAPWVLGVGDSFMAGYSVEFAESFAGIDMMVKNTELFANTNGWGFFNFGHHAPPYAETATAAPNDACAFCHTANATDDMVFTTFYPILERP